MFDYLIVGSGLFGAVFAHEARKKGKKCMVIEKRNHIGGNVYCENIEGINVHKYGPHIFHTNDTEIWEYINRFSEFNRFTNSPIANYKGEIYNLPFNMNTFHKLWGVITPAEAKRKIEEQKIQCVEPKNLEEQAISLVGYELYEKLIKGYTEKQWGREVKNLPAFIIKRLPVRFTYDNNYFQDRYQGIPIEGYNTIIEKMLDGCDVRTNVNFFDEKEKWLDMADKIVFTGMIDEFYDYRLGELSYRSLAFESEIIHTDNYQGSAIVNYTDAQTKFTRIVEHKHFEFGQQEKTVITREYSKEWKRGDEPYYPVNDEKNNSLYLQYKALANKETNIIFGGRLAQYKYYDMWQVIQEALRAVRKEAI